VSTYSKNWKAFRALSWSERRLFLIAVVLLPATAFGVRILGLTVCQSLLMRLTPARMKREVPPEDSLREARAAARLVQAAAVHGMYRATCLPQSLTLWWLLRHRGIQGGFHIGMQRENGEWRGHAWVEYCGTVLSREDDPSVRYTSLPELRKRLTRDDIHR
jgi:hypothetical protein